MFASTDPQHRACAPRQTHPTEGTRRGWPMLAAAQRALLRSADARQMLRPRRPTAMHITVTAKKPARGSPRPAAAAAASPSGTWRPRCARRCVRRGRHPRPGVPHSSPTPSAESQPLAATPAIRHAERPSARSANLADDRKRAPLPAAAFFICRANENRPHKAAGSAVAKWSSAQWPSSSSSSA